MNIKPTIGRRVWYWPSSFDKGRLQLKPDTIMQTGDPIKLVMLVLLMFIVIL
jgi:hypothetical protein